MAKIYRPISDREAARRIAVHTIRQGCEFIELIRLMQIAGLVICERVEEEGE